MPGQKIDRLSDSSYPDPFSIPCSPTSNFQNETKTINFPHTDLLRVL